VTIIYFRDLPPERIAPAISSRRSEVAPQPSHPRQELAGHPWLARLREWARRRRSRTLLVQLDDYLLKDIGITYAEAEREANKPFWLP
jgi:uncharacterized protein YjiS (DUF1127 family)